jgi:hypothetical protein
LILEPKPRRKRSKDELSERNPKIFQLFTNLFNPERTGKKKNSAENKDDNNDES